MKKLIIGIAILVIAAIIGYNYIYKSHRNISEEEAAYTLTASELVNQFSNDASLSQEKYLNQTIVISGEISEISNVSITLNNSIFCTMNEGFVADSYKGSKNVSVKGRFIGYDDLLEEIKLDQCSITNKN